MLSPVVAGFVAVLVGFTSSVAIVFQAATAVGATPAVIVSWMWALGLGMGLTSMALSWFEKKPVLTAWSTPGAALIAGTGGLTLADATGAFVVSSLLITAAGASGGFARVMHRIPQPLAAGLLAGVLLRFAVDAFGALRSDTVLVAVMLLALLVGRRWWPRYAVPGVLAAGAAVAALHGQLHFGGIDWSPATPVFTAPHFTLASAVGLGVPLFVVTMASQNLPGVAAQRAAGFDVPVSRSITVTGLASLVLSPFGGYALNLAAITAAICMGPEAHPDPAQRWRAAFAAGVIYVAVGLLGGAVVGLIAAFPKALVLALGGFALLGTIGASLHAALRDDASRDAALVTFVVAASGMVLGGIGAAFWAVVAGGVTLAVQHWRPAWT